VGKEELGVVDTSRSTEGDVAVGGDYFDVQSRRVLGNGYAVPFRGLRQPRFDLYEYPWLDSFFAGHFLDSVFATLHTFGFESHHPLVLRFCPQDRARPSIQGTLEFDADSALARVTWVFLTDDPVEHAGGEVLFSRPDTNDPSRTIYPVIGLFWRKLVFDYYQEWMEFLEWHTCQREPDPHHCP
jgi:hypothetical protein